MKTIRLLLTFTLLLQAASAFAAFQDTKDTVYRTPSGVNEPAGFKPAAGEIKEACDPAPDSLSDKGQSLPEIAETMELFRRLIKAVKAALADAAKNTIILNMLREKARKTVENVKAKIEDASEDVTGAAEDVSKTVPR